MYQTLYRKYRPTTFSDVLSQPHITTTLKNQIVLGKTAHAYLFTGSRGTGKTTCARILAKTLNCQNPQNGDPCLECEACRLADENAMTDIIEIDAASNNGVDNVRGLREAAAFLPQTGKYRVYIIDEVHMMSVAAFNALLKILEEPPEHIKFILATTEIHKVPVTIVSRCQHFDFHRIKTEDIVTRLNYISEQENFKLDSSAKNLIAKLADGGMRDALSLLDQCASTGEDISGDDVLKIAGIANRSTLFDIVGCIAEKDFSQAISIVDRLYMQAKDMRRLCEEITEIFRDIMITKSVLQEGEKSIENFGSLLNCLDDNEKSKVVKIAEKFSLSQVLKILDCLHKTKLEFARAVSPLTTMEICLVNLCLKENGSVVDTENGQISEDMSAVYARISKLEYAIRNANMQAVYANKHTPNTNSKPPEPPKKPELQENLQNNSKPATPPKPPQKSDLKQEDLQENSKPIKSADPTEPVEQTNLKQENLQENSKPVEPANSTNQEGDFEELFNAEDLSNFNGTIDLGNISQTDGNFAENSDENSLDSLIEPQIKVWSEKHQTDVENGEYDLICKYETEKTKFDEEKSKLLATYFKGFEAYKNKQKNEIVVKLSAIWCLSLNNIIHPKDEKEESKNKRRDCMSIFREVFGSYYDQETIVNFEIKPKTTV